MEYEQGADPNAAEDLKPIILYVLLRTIQDSPSSMLCVTTIGVILTPCNLSSRIQPWQMHVSIAIAREWL